MTALDVAKIQAFPAKLADTSVNGVSTPVLGISVLQHGLLAGYVLGELLDHIKTRNNEPLIPLTLQVLAALHDVGKINPEFLRKLLSQLAKDVDASYWRTVIEQSEEITEVPHPLISCAVLEALGAPIYCGEVVAEHHGHPKGFVHDNRSDFLGGESWAEARKGIAEDLVHHFSADSVFPRCIRNRSIKPIQIELWKGLVVLADWIASRQGLAVPSGTEKEVAHRLVKEAGFQVLSINKGKTFEDVFSFPPRAPQSLLMDAYVGPGVYVLEAPTGCGKTEAALGLAFKAILNGDASGVYFALPTQLTSDRAHDRVEAAVGRFLDRAQDVRLAHGAALLKRMKLGKEGEPGQLWYTSSRLALLAPFAVGTVDQALLALLNTKFHQVRLAGLCGKVVILDEVHSYDTYTTELITRLVSVLEAMGAVVVILSATLTHTALRRILGTETDIPPALEATALTIKTKEGIQKKALPILENRSVTIKLLEDVDASKIALDEVIKCAQAGMQVLWIENTVREAQKVFQAILAQGVTCGLVHSRYRCKDRAQHEQYWTAVFGKEGSSERHCEGRILVGTQVLEQSLDLDADFMVTRIAPMDLLIQRFGRLWRHQETVRPKECRSPSAWILATPEEEGAFVTATGLSQPFGVTGKIYHPYTLFRTLEVLKERLQSSSNLVLPHEVRALLSKALEPREEQSIAFIPFWKELIAIEREKLDKAIGALSLSHQVERAVGTRLISQENYETLVLFEEDQSVFESCQSKEDVILAIEERLVSSPRKIMSVGVAALGKWLPPELSTWLKNVPRYRSLSVCFCLLDGRLTGGDELGLLDMATYSKVVGLDICARNK